VRLQELDALRTRFLVLAAHELRTPLHVLGAALEVLASLGLEGEAPALLATAERNVRWLGRSVAAMTDLVRLAQPERHGPYRAAALDLATIVRRVATDMAPFCARRRLALVVETAESPPASGNADELHHALVNLCLNAIRFTPDGGCVTLALRAVSDETHLVVTDTGIGIAQELLPRLGEPFVTGAPLDAHHSDPIAFQSAGLGLGLAVARAIAVAHGGALHLESTEGQGTSATLVVPVPPSIDSPSGRRENAP
jgi:signal transduction histidine kinase